MLLSLFDFLLLLRTRLVSNKPDFSSVISEVTNDLALFFLSTFSLCSFGLEKGVSTVSEKFRDCLEFELSGSK